MSDISVNTSNNEQSYDKVMLYILLAHLPITALIIPLGFGTSTFAIIASLLNGLFFGAAYLMCKNTRAFRVFASIALMIFSAIMIQSQLGRLEMHFHIFSALALTLIYRDWIAPLSAAVVIALHHVLLTMLQLSEASMGGMPIVIYAVECNWTITFIHAAFVVLETAGLVYFAIKMRQEQVADLAVRELISEMVANNNLTARAAGSSYTEKLSNQLANEFDQLISFLKQGNHKLIQTSEEMRDLSQQASSSLQEQREYGDRVAAASHQMASNASEVANHASGALDTATQIREASEQCTELTNSNVKLISQLNAELSQMAESIDKLKEDSLNIGTVLDVIRSVSDQTNLLALNAAIEAARAGEQGRGFAVVADEVRMLAQRTQESTNEIQSMVETLQSSAQQVVTDMHEGRELVSASHDSIGQSESALAQIADNVERLVEINNLVANASNDQSAVCEEVSRDITKIFDAVASLEQPNLHLAENAEELASISNSLGEQIADYKVAPSS